jgi:4-amino-4-deoxy-L-arabinose transferase-like glycosyltransferase
MPPLSRRAELLLLAAITALAACLRLYRLDALPPGDGHDVAMYGVDALQILAGARPIFLESNFGREPLFSYLVALAYRFTGPGAYGIHLVSAIAGILTVPAVWLAARELFAGARHGALAYLPLLAAFLSAVSYWHLNWSRVGLRVILVPLFAALIVFALWRGFHSSRPDRLRQPVRSWGWFLLAGALLGLSLYTYQAARLLPALVAVAFVLRAVERQRWARENTAAALLVAAAALVVFLPLGVYAAQHPGALSVRIQQATVVQPGLPLAQQVGELARQATTALLTYSVRGDTDPQFTIPGRPSLNPFLSLGLLIGIITALWRLRRSPYLFLLAWLLLMTAPAMVADQAATAKRYLGAFPAVMMLVALGLLLPLDGLERRGAGEQGSRGEETIPPAARHAPPATRLWSIVLIAGLLYTLFVTWRDYFVVWAADPDLPAHFQADYRTIGEFIGGLDAAQPVWLSPFPADHPVIQLHAGLRPDLRGYNGRFCLPYADPVGQRGATYVIVPGLQDSSLALLQAMYPTGETVEGPLRPGSDRPYYRAFHAPADARSALRPDVTLAAQWVKGIELLGYAKEGDVARGQTITVTLFYRATAAPPANYIAFVHLLGPAKDDGSPLWAQSDSEPCGGGRPTGQWRAGDVIRDTVTLTLPPDLPAGEYQLVTGFYTWPELQRLVSNDGRDAIELATFNIAAP